MRVAAAIVAGLLSVSAAAAQSTGTSGDKPETACTTSPAATTGKGEEKTANSMSVETSAVLPAGGANSAAPTIAGGGKPLKASRIARRIRNPSSAGAWRAPFISAPQSVHPAESPRLASGPSSS